MKKLFIILLIISFCSGCGASYVVESTAPKIDISASEEPVSEPDEMPIPENTTSPEAEYSYIGNVNTYKFHLPSCHTLPMEKNRVYFSSRDEALEEGFTPCGNCMP